jgi:PAP2 superfamily
VNEPRRARWYVELLVIGSLTTLYDTITNLAPAREGAAIAHGRGIVSLEHALSAAPELGLNRWLVHHHTLGLIASYYYDNAHFIVTLGLLAWMWWARPDAYRPLRSVLVAVNLIGLLVFWLYPVAPPRLLGSGFTDVVAASHTFGSWHTGSLAADADQFAAMPSLHIAWAAWCGLVVWRLCSRRWLRAAAVTYPLLTAVAVLATGNHYLLDVLAGGLTLAFAVAAVRLTSVRHVTKLLRSRRTGRLAAASEDAL